MASRHKAADMPVGDVAGNVAVHNDRLLPDAGVEGRGPLDRRRLGQLAGRQLDERDEMRRIVGMGCQGAPGQPGVALDGRNGEPRGTGGDQGFVGRLLADLGEDAALEVEVIADALLDEKGLFDGLPQGSGDSCKRSHPLLGRPGLRETFRHQEAGRGGGAHERCRRRPFPHVV